MWSQVKVFYHLRKIRGISYFNSDHAFDTSLESCKALLRPSSCIESNNCYARSKKTENIGSFYGMTRENMSTVMNDVVKICCK